MNLFCIIAFCVTGLIAALSVLALPLWLMGVPGVENSYAKGWKIGLWALLIYPVLWFSVLAFWRAAKKRTEPEHLSVLNLRISIGTLLILAVATAVMFYAFKIMSRKP